MGKNGNYALKRRAILKKNKNRLLAISSGLILSLAWIPNLTFLIFVSWIPFFSMLEKVWEDESIKKKNKTLFGLSFLSFFIWNTLVTWWIVYASFVGVALAILVNSTLMSLTVLLFFQFYKKYKKHIALYFFIPVWLAYEYFHLQWDASWPWLNLGNVFSFQTNWIQWYEYTGVSGGSAWILLVNISIYCLIINKKYTSIKSSLTTAFILVLPLVFSYLILQARTFISSRLNPIETVIVQPNLDPYSEKFYISPDIQLKNLLKQIEGKVDEKTDMLVLPETFLTENIWENNINGSGSIQFLKDSILKKFPKLHIVTGGSSLLAYEKQFSSATERKFSDGPGYYDYFNSAFYIHDTEKINVYHKSKLVPGVEKMPFPTLFKPLEAFALDLGGTIGSLGIQEQRGVFSLKKREAKIAPIICYESIYGEYVTDYVKNGANLFCILTNDGWWNNTPGYKQHLAYGSLRAIENRKQIARSANTGTSCFIDEFGSITLPTPFWEEAVIKSKCYPNTYESFYSKFGDVLSKLAILSLLVLLVSTLWITYSKNKL